MTIKIAVNGFGRIGRLTLRALLKSDRTDICVVAINDLASAEINAHLLSFDTVHGEIASEVTSFSQGIQISGRDIPFYQERDPKNLPWKKLGVDIVFECTGIFTEREKAMSHITAGAKRVLISAPGKNIDKTIVYGVNHQELTADDIIVSNASCTTNCLSPLVKVLNDTMGIVHGNMFTVHAATGDQKIVDTAHEDFRRARGSLNIMIPTTTGAAKAVSLVLPEFHGLLQGSSVRVPTDDVSMVNFIFESNRSTSIDEVNGSLTKAAEGSLLGVLSVEARPLVSSDFKGNSASSIIDLAQTQVTNGTLVKVLAWYDNEWGFSNRMLDTAAVMGKFCN